METQMWGGSITRQDLLQSISLLRILSEVPALPGQNVPDTDVESARCLSISREKEIAGNLAFLSALSYNNKRVMAVCVEEDYDKNEITIRVAANTGDLSNVVEGFKRIAKVLEQAARRGTCSSFAEIILNCTHLMDSQKIPGLRTRKSFFHKWLQWISGEY
jgi:hypothetical protein